MELIIKDRLYIPTLLPQKGNFKEFNLKKEILKKVEITEAERQEVGLSENKESKRIEWDTHKETPLHVEFSKDELDFLQSACEKISDQELPDDMWLTVEKLYNAIQAE